MARLTTTTIAPKRRYYQNLETGLVRCFSWGPPKRGKWELTTQRRESPALGRAKFAARRRALQKEGGS